MTVVSTPAASSRIAAVWRSTCGVIFFSARVGQTRAAVAVCLVSRRSRASRLSAVPRRVGNSGSVGSPARSASQARRTATVAAVSGVIRCFAALAVAADVRAGAEVDVGAGQRGEFGGAQPGLDGEQQQGVVAAAGPGVAVGGGEQRVDLGLGEVGDDGAVEAFGRDRQDPLR